MKKLEKLALTVGQEVIEVLGPLIRDHKVTPEPPPGFITIAVTSVIPPILHHRHEFEQEGVPDDFDVSPYRREIYEAVFRFFHDAGFQIEVGGA